MHRDQRLKKKKKKHVNTLLIEEGSAGVPLLIQGFSNQDSGSCCCTCVPVVVHSAGCVPAWGFTGFLADVIQR